MKKLTVLIIVLLAVGCLVSTANAQRMWTKSIEITGNDWYVTGDAFSISSQVNRAKAIIVATDIVGSGYLAGATKNVYLTGNYLALTITSEGSDETPWIPFTPAELSGWYLKMWNMDTGDCSGSYTLQYKIVEEIP